MAQDKRLTSKYPFVVRLVDSDHPHSGHEDRQTADGVAVYANAQAAKLGIHARYIVTERES